MKLLSKSVNLNSNRGLSYNKMKNWYGNLVKPRTIPPPYKHITQIGDPTLRLKAQPVDVDTIKSVKVQKIIKQMRDVFEKYNSVGLAAPQIGVPLRIIAIGFSNGVMKQWSAEEIQARDMTLLPFTIVINPEVKITDYNKLVFPESCESVKGYWADVPRFKAVNLNGFNQNGEALNLETKGWLSRIIQHEMDHLNGTLYTDIMNRKSLTCGGWEIINERNGSVNLPYKPS
ncbi:PREDICTED: peptide deformylase, mitochondrial-like [Nicrophorus vespilloides]|uniref:Peptide deformylase n=1 Tax=Nicrophorus vespilloides TaxID=110193 RepID=A0ABM1MQQ8_NICVS|nr:PREDICTED: peptide deformylase, mitochondrial-like [Nicrophorus vespilloides]